MATNILKAGKIIFKKKAYLSIFAVSTILFMIIFILLPKFGTLFSFWGLPYGSFFEKILFSYRLFEGFFIENSFWEIIYSVSIAILLGLNISFFVFFARSLYAGSKISKSLFAGAGGGGLLAILGGGCAACGTFVISYLLSIFGAQWFILYLPLEGKEFGIIGIILMAVSLGFISQRIADSEPPSPL